MKFKKGDIVTFIYDHSKTEKWPEWGWVQKIKMCVRVLEGTEIPSPSGTLFKGVVIQSNINNIEIGSLECNGHTFNKDMCCVGEVGNFYIDNFKLVNKISKHII